MSNFRVSWKTLSRGAAKKEMKQELYEKCIVQGRNINKYIYFCF